MQSDEVERRDEVPEFGVGDVVSWRGRTPATSTTEGDMHKTFHGTVVGEVRGRDGIGPIVGYTIVFHASIGGDFTTIIWPPSRLTLVSRSGTESPESNEHGQPRVNG